MHSNPKVGDVRNVDVFELDFEAGVYSGVTLTLKQKIKIESNGLYLYVIKAELDDETYMAIITSSINNSIKIPDDSVFKISNNGFIGPSYIEIELGNSEELLKNDDYSNNNIDAVSLEEIINNFIFD